MAYGENVGVWRGKAIEMKTMKTICQRYGQKSGVMTVTINRRRIWQSAWRRSVSGAAAWRRMLSAGDENDVEEEAVMSAQILRNGARRRLSHW